MKKIQLAIIATLLTYAACSDNCQLRRRHDSTFEIVCSGLKEGDLNLRDALNFEEDYAGFTLNVRRIEFKGCTVKNIPQNTFKLLPKITQIILSNMSLETIENGAFQGIRRLKLLDLSDNRLSVVPDLSYIGLRHLNLNNNPTLIKPTNGPLVEAEHLEWLSLRNCAIEHLSGSAFSRNPYLSHLDLSYNSLSQLPDTIFSVNKLTFLDISNNKFSSIKRDVFKNIPGYPNQISKVIVANNPWHCDCKLAPAHIWLTADLKTHFPTDDPKRSRIYKETKCLTPVNLQGVSWTEIKEWNCNL